jgi:tRNA pseudouridine38-40 synthase
MRRFKLTIEYDGTPYSGWQRQKDVPSIQAEIEAAILKFSQTQVTLHCAGRTDAGVHALAQVAHADINTQCSAFTVREALNYFLQNKHIVILECDEVDNSFHARFDAKKRYYEYHIMNRRAPLALAAVRAWHVRQPLDVDAMHEAAQYFVGTHDFTSFRDTDCQAKSPIKTLDAISIAQRGEHIVLSLEAQSFLHHQVRIMTGAIVDAGKGKFAPNHINTMLEARCRTKGGVTAPAHGLFFIKVDY